MKKKKKSTLRSVLICLFAVLTFAVYASPAQADPPRTYWTGTTDTNWFNPANWDNQVPTSTTDAVINNGGKAEIDTPGAVARTVTIGALPGDSGNLVVDGTSGGSLTVPPSCNGNIDDPGYIGIGIYVGYGGTGTMSIVNNGTVTSEYCYIGLLPSDGTHRPSNGAVTINGATSTWTLSGGTGCADARVFVGGNNTVANHGGTALLNIAAGGTVKVINSASGNVSVSVGLSGTLTGNGTIDLTYSPGNANYTLVKGTFAPSGGTFTISGSLRLDPAATTLCNVTPNSHDMAYVSEQAVLDGRLSVLMAGDFRSAPPQYTLLHALAIFPNTMFQSYSLKYPTDQGWTPQIAYDGQNVYLNRVSNLHP